MSRTLAACVSLSLLSFATPSLAQAPFPNRPMTMVVPFAAGGAVDVLGRTIAARAGEILGQQIIVENVGGAGGMTGSARVAKAAPDGYQFVLGSVGTHAQGQWLHKHLAYEVAADFDPVILVGETPLLLVARKDFPADNLKDFIAYAKAHPGDLKFGSAGVGSAIHMGCVLFNAAAGITANHIPYRGGAPAMQDLIAGRIDYSCNIITSAYPQVRDHVVKSPALLAGKRTPLLPDLPTAQEQGMAGFNAGSWNVVFLPKGTPAAIVDKLNAAFSEAMDSPDTEKRLVAIGIDIAAKDRRSPAYAAKFVEQEIKKYEGPIKASGISIE
jgi:tripartite-type tricarboxylate transporter receptor subunit TctC